MQLAFSKMNGLGNDFVFIEDLDSTLELAPEAVAWFCDRHFGVGGDGLILVRPATNPAADYYMHYFNADGSLAEMCGNGARCFAKYVVDRGLIPADADSLVIQTLGGLKPVTFTRNEAGELELATIDMGEPVLVPALIPTTFEGERVVDAHLMTDAGDVHVTCVSMGNPHAVIFVDDVEDAPVDILGPIIEVHERFPRHTNVEFAEVVDDATLRLRVWERGVSETLACGTGACATVVAAALLGHTGREVTVELPGGDLLIEWGDDDHVYMTGSAAFSFNGTIELAEEA